MTITVDESSTSFTGTISNGNGFNMTVRETVDGTEYTFTKIPTESTNIFSRIFSMIFGSNEQSTDSLISNFMKLFTGFFEALASLFT